MSIKALLIITKKYKQPKCPSASEQTKDGMLIQWNINPPQSE